MEGGFFFLNTKTLLSKATFETSPAHGMHETDFPASLKLPRFHCFLNHEEYLGGAVQLK